MEASAKRAQRRIAVLTVVGVVLALAGDDPFRSGMDLKWVSIALAKWGGVMLCYFFAVRAALELGRCRQKLDG